MRFVEPLELVFLGPGLRVAHAALQLVHVSMESLLHRIVNVDLVAGPVVVRARRQVVEAVALACGSGDNAQTEARR